MDYISLEDTKYVTVYRRKAQLNSHKYSYHCAVSTVISLIPILTRTSYNTVLFYIDIILEFNNRREIQ